MLDSQDQGAEHKDGTLQPNPNGMVGPTHTCTHRTLQELVLLGSCPWRAQPCLPPTLLSFHAPWWARGQLAGGALQKETFGQGVKFLGSESCHARQQQSLSKNPLISIPRALHFFRREAPTFSSQSKYQALILCVNRLASAATDECSFGKFIVAIKRVSPSLSLFPLPLSSAN